MPTEDLTELILKGELKKNNISNYVTVILL